MDPKTSPKDYIVTRTGNGFKTMYCIKEMICSRRSQFQLIEIIENGLFGRMLFLDGDLQLSESDVDIYNQSMIAPLIEAGKAPGRIAILGGGDGGVLNEILKHDPGKVYLVDIDREVVEACKEHMPGVCGNAFEDPRVELINGDTNLFLDRHGDFDSIIYDLTMHPEDIIDVEPREFLEDIFGRIARALKPGGVLSGQCFSILYLRMPSLHIGSFFSDASFCFLIYALISLKLCALA